MATNEYDTYVHDDYGPPKPWISPLVWSGLILLAFIVYEATTQPALASVTLCVKFGWEDFRTAFWLKRNDPQRTRGKACGAFFFAFGLWKIILASLFMFFALLVVIAPAAPPALAVQQPGPALVWVAPLMLSWFGFWLLGAVICCSVFLALRRRVRFWLSPGVHRARRDNIWPPASAFSGRHNWAGLLLMSSLLLMALPVPLFIVFFDLAVGDLLGIAIFFGSLAAGPLGFFLVKRVLRHIIAASPQDCWGDEDLSDTKLVPEYEH